MARMRTGTYFAQDKNFNSIYVGDKVRDIEGNVYTVNGYGGLDNADGKTVKKVKEWKPREHMLIESAADSVAAVSAEAVAATGPTPEDFDNGIEMLKNENRKIQLLNKELAEDNERLKDENEKLAAAEAAMRKGYDDILQQCNGYKDSLDGYLAERDTLIAEIVQLKKGLEDAHDCAANEAPDKPAAPLLDRSEIHPDYYRSYGMEVLFMMEKIWGIEAVKTFCKLNAFKYRMRMGKKDDMGVDFDKEQFYLQYALNLEAGACNPGCPKDNHNGHKIRWDSLIWENISTTPQGR